MHPLVLIGIYLGLTVVYAVGHWYIIEVLDRWITKEGHFWWAVGRGVFTSAYAYLAYGFSWQGVWFCMTLLALFWLVFNPLLNWMRGFDWDHINEDSFWDVFPTRDPVGHLIVRSATTVLSAAMFTFFYLR